MAVISDPPERILRIKPVIDRTGLAKSTLYLRIEEGTFPRPIKLGKRAVGWVESEIDAWIESRIKNRDDRI